MERHSPRKSSVITWPQTDVILKRAGCPAKAPLYSCTEQVPFSPLREDMLPRERILAMDWAKDGFSATMSTVFILPRAASAPPHSALRKRLRHRVGAASPQLLR